MDMSIQAVKMVATSNPDQYSFGGLVCGVPSFWGDDDAVTMQIFDPSRGSLAYKVPLNNWEGLPEKSVELNEHTLVKPIMHRVGVRQLTAEIDFDKKACAFDGAASAE